MPHMVRLIVCSRFIFQTVFTDAQHCIIRTDVPSSGIATKAAHQPAYLRTFKIPVMKTAVQQKVQEAVAELGLSSSRLVIPTRENVAQLDATLEAMLALLETKRLVEKAEYDIQVLKKQLGLREQSTADGKGTISGMESVHVDYAPKGGDVVGETSGENERSQSVLSVRSARSRKHVSIDVSINYSVPDCVSHSHDARCRFPQWTLSRQELARNDRNEPENDS